MPFGLVSAWNKRRRSKSNDHTDPCMLLSFQAICGLEYSPFNSFSAMMVSQHNLLLLTLTDSHLSGVYKAVEFWQLEDQSPQPTKRHHGSSVFTLKEMDEATGSFSDENFLGKGGFGRVYRGTLRSGEVCLDKTKSSQQY